MNLRFDNLKLANGLQVIGEYNPFVQSVAMGFFVNTGSRDEVAEISGVSHFLEHMMFKGTDSRSAEDINQDFDRIGALYNAYTNKEHTVYYGAVLKEKAFDLLDILSDMLRPALRESDFELEKKVILEEIAMYEDRPDFKVFEKGYKHFYNEHPLGNSVGGSPESVSNLKIEQMRDYFEERYASDNLVFVLAGNYDWQKMVDMLEALTSNWHPANSERKYPNLERSSSDGLEPDQKLNRSHVALFSNGYSAQDDRRYAAAIISNLVGGGSGRLYWALTDKGLVDTASLSHDSSDQAGSFLGYLSSNPKDLDDVLNIYNDVVNNLDDISQEEWQRARRKLASSITMRAETPFNRLMSLGRRYLYNKNYQALDKTVSMVLNTELEQGQELLERKPFANMVSYKLSP